MGILSSCTTSIVVSLDYVQLRWNLWKAVGASAAYRFSLFDFVVWKEDRGMLVVCVGSSRGEMAYVTESLGFEITMMTTIHIIGSGNKCLLPTGPVSILFSLIAMN